MYFSLTHMRDFTDNLIAHLTASSAETLSHVDIFVIPDFVAVTSVVEQVKQSPVPVWVGAQDCHWEDYGAFTGEVSPAVLRDAGVRIVEVGHAERRRLFGEDDPMVARKAAAVARNGMLPLVCIGEKKRHHDDAAAVMAAIEECRGQVETVMEAMPPDAEVVLAYEPVWAIGAAQPAADAHVLNVVDGIRGLDCIRHRTGITRVVYGGSAGPGLFTRLKQGLDGVFLGRFGQDPERLVKTIEEVAMA
jgi:triosephosphate isomerase